MAVAEQYSVVNHMTLDYLLPLISLSCRSLMNSVGRLLLFS